MNSVVTSEKSGCVSLSATLDSFCQELEVRAMSPLSLRLQNDFSLAVDVPRMVSSSDIVLPGGRFKMALFFPDGKEHPCACARQCHVLRSLLTDEVEESEQELQALLLSWKTSPADTPLRNHIMEDVPLSDNSSLQRTFSLAESVCEIQQKADQLFRLCALLPLLFCLFSPSDVVFVSCSFSLLMDPLSNLLACCVRLCVFF